MPSVASDPTFTLLMRHGCHLCDAFLHELLQLQQQLDFTYHSIDIDQSREYQTHFNDKVPVLLYQGQEVCRYFLDPQHLSDILSG